VGKLFLWWLFLCGKRIISQGTSEMDKNQIVFCPKLWCLGAGTHLHCLFLIGWGTVSRVLIAILVCCADWFASLDYALG